jgi:hypothetical protein
VANLSSAKPAHHLLRLSCFSELSRPKSSLLLMFDDPPITLEQREAELEDLRHDPLLTQLRNDIRAEVAQHLPKFRYRESEFSQIDTGEILSIYLSWKYRHVHPHPRDVVCSAELSERIRTDDALYSPVKSEFDELTKIIAAGDDLLSRKLLSPAVVRKPYELKPDYSQLNHEDHLDLLLNEQGIYHLHLPGLERKKDAPIVFAIFEPHPSLPPPLFASSLHNIEMLAKPLSMLSTLTTLRSSRLSTIGYTSWDSCSFFNRRQ